MDDTVAPAASPDATLEVTDHFFFTGRGGVVVGRPVRGRAQVGMNAQSPVTGEGFRVAGCGSARPRRGAASKAQLLCAVVLPHGKSHPKSGVGHHDVGSVMRAPPQAFFLPFAFLAARLVVVFLVSTATSGLAPAAFSPRFFAQ